jgi:Protein of unknown function (DUF1176)
MSLSFVRILVAGTLLAAPAFANPVTPGEQFFHKNWAAACDNSLACEAVSLAPDGNMADAPWVRIARDSGVETVTVKIGLTKLKGDRYRILIDGRLIDSGLFLNGEWAIEADARNALKLARAIGRGRKMLILGADGTKLGERSLNGSAAALIHIDLLQNRAWTRSALLRKGRKALRPKSVPLPVIAAQRIGKAAVVPDAGTIIGVVENSGCTADPQAVTENSAISLGKRDGSNKVLVLVSCGSGAYNMAMASYVGTSTDGKKWSFTPARFDYTEKPGAGLSTVTLLSNAEWDAPNQQLNSFHKGRGLGDCGNSARYVWDGVQFRLIEAKGMDECSGAHSWMTLWRAKVELAD